MVGAYFFARMSFGRRWHHHGIPLPAVTIFASTMAVLTILHWDNFTHDNFVFFLWAFLYAVTPFIVIGVWLWNRSEDPGTPEDSGIAVPTPIRQGLMLSGFGGVIVAIVLFFFPDLAIDIWPWTLSTLTARVVAGWIALGGSAAILVGRDVRWSAWRIPFETTFLWTVLLAIGIVRFTEDFGWSAFCTWAFLAIIAGPAVSFGTVLVMMERHQQQTYRASRRVIPRSVAPMYDVIIVGGSFAGLAVAMQLRGHRVLIVNQHPIGSHQSSTCGTPLRLARMVGAEPAILEQHDAVVMHAAGRAVRFPLPEPYVTFDYHEFCQRMLHRTDAGVQIVRATGRTESGIQTTDGEIAGRFVVHASGWHATP